MTETSKTETSKRTKLTKRQLDALQAAFSDGQMPDAAKRQVLADELGLTPRCVQNAESLVSSERPVRVASPPTRSQRAQPPRQTATPSERHALPVEADPYAVNVRAPHNGQ